MPNDSVSSGSSFGQTFDLYADAVTELPSAAAEFAKEAWDHKIETAGHILRTGATSVGMGAVLGYILPAKGPAAWIVGAAFTVPMIYHAGKGLYDAHEESLKPGADRDKISHGLAKSTVSGGFDFAINMVGGYYGTEIGFKLANRGDSIGGLAQAGQRGILKAENETLLAMRSKFGTKTETTGTAATTELGLPKTPVDTLTGRQGDTPGPIVNRDLETQLVQTKTAALEPELQTGWLKQPVAKFNRRLDQYDLVNTKLERSLGEGTEPYQTYRGTLHAHTVFDDGMGYPKEIFAQAKKEGLDVLAITPHNHDGARKGVPPNDPRAAEQAKVPILAKTPEQYGQIVNAAESATVPGEFVGMYGIEMGTIGPAGHSHAPSKAGKAEKFVPGETQTGSLLGKQTAIMDGIANGTIKPNQNLHMDEHVHTDGHAHAHHGKNALVDEQVPTGQTAAELIDSTDPLALARKTHHGGVNHINAFGIRDALVVADRQSSSQGIMGFGLNLLYRLAGREPVKVPELVHYPDGNYKELAQIFAKHRDTTGENVIVQLNHPRYRTNKETDYGIGSFKSRAEWREKFADPHIRLQEIVKGEALNPDPLPNMKPGDVDPHSFIGYMDMGVHAGPTFGRDSHYGNPGGRPAGTGILAKNLDEASIFEALRNRRTFATTNYENLQGVLIANDKFYMGSILDQAAVPDMTLKVKIGGKIDPQAEYTVSLWGDKKIGDGRLATSMQETTVTGADLLGANKEISFDPISHKLGNKSGYFVEINRVDPATSIVDRMWTAPIWVEPLTGATHGAMTRFLVGSGAQMFTPSWPQGLH